MKLITNTSIKNELISSYAEILDELTLREYLVTVYRPFYSPVRDILLSIKPRSSVLEIGCGTGPILHAIDRFCKIERGVGIDINEHSVDIAQRSIKPGGVLEFRMESLYNLDAIFFSQFDYIICFDIFHHLPKNEKYFFLRYLSHKMRKESILIFKDLDTKPVHRAIINMITDFISTRSIVSYISMKTIDSYLHNNGYNILKIFRRDDWLWNHFLVVACKQ